MNYTPVLQENLDPLFYNFSETLTPYKQRGRVVHTMRFVYNCIRYQYFTKFSDVCVCVEILWNYIVSVEFPLSFFTVTKLPQNFLTNKLGEILVF